MAFQVGSAFLDACVLAVLAREDTYGYVLTQQMRKVVDISESTLYPVLRRLQKGGYLSTYDSPYQGRNRRYYRITEEGMRKYGAYRDEWIWHKARVDELMFGEACSPKDTGPAMAEGASGQTGSGTSESGTETESERSPKDDSKSPKTELSKSKLDAEQRKEAGTEKEKNEIGGGTDDE